MSDDPNVVATAPVLTAEDTPQSFVPDPATEEERVMSRMGDTPAGIKLTPPNQSQAALDKINSYRQQAGVGVAKMHPALKAAAEAHATYYAQNGAVPSIHEEQEGRPGFSGKTMADRPLVFGYPSTGSFNENADTTANPVAAVDRLMATLNHRIPMLDLAYPDMGIGAASTTAGSNAITVIDFAMPVWKTNFQPEFIIWPPENGLNFFRRYGGEGPDLFRRAGITPAYPIGCPITITYRGAGKIVYDAAGMSLQILAGAPVECYKLADLNSFWTARNSAAIAAVQPLAPDTAYQVTFTYRINGGPPQKRSWKFSTGSSLEDVTVTVPPGVKAADPNVRNLWVTTDGPVAAGQSQRSWLYGPDVFESRTEPYAESPGGQRQVYYFDKARLEINNPAGDRSSQWFVTSGLVVRELISGNVQLGDNAFQAQGSAANVAVAGDPFEVNGAAPTYASFINVTSLNNDRRADFRVGLAVDEKLNADGTISQLNSPPFATNYAMYEGTLGHNIPAVFVPFLNRLPNGWVFVMGLPIAEAYWMRVKLAGRDTDVLTQMFERRSLTFTPSNPSAFQVEMGNVGRHYRAWRQS